MEKEFTLPDLGEGVESADVAHVYVSEGDVISANQSVLELETEKATTDLPCPREGKIIKVHVAQGDTVHVGQTILSVEHVEAETESPTNDHESQEHESTKEDPISVQQPAVVEASASEQEPSGTDQQFARRREGDGHQLPPAGPATRRLARNLGVELEQFNPPKGSRITQEDVVRAYVEQDRAAAIQSVSLPDFTQYGDVDREPLNRIAQTAARRLSASWQTIPHVTQHGLADITDLESLRQQYNERTGAASPKITMTSIAMKTVACLLREFPRFNSSLDVKSNELVLKRYYHIGVAVDTDHGLLVPVVRNVDRKSIDQLSAELQTVANHARRRQLGQDDFKGGSFTISNQGGIGGGEFTPIVNYPEVAILGIARARKNLRMVAGAPVERLMLPLSLSYDHRVINGADAARFMNRLTQVLSDSFRMLVAM